MRLDRNRPEILAPPHTRRPAAPSRPSPCRRDLRENPAKTRLSIHAHRNSYARRTGAERTFSTVKDPASNAIARGWCRLMGLTPLALWLACLHAVRNQRILTAWNARQAENDAPRRRRPPPQNTQRRRKTTLASLTAPP